MTMIVSQPDDHEWRHSGGWIVQGPITSGKKPDADSGAPGISILGCATREALDCAGRAGGGEGGGGGGARKAATPRCCRLARVGGAHAGAK